MGVLSMSLGAAAGSRQSMSAFSLVPSSVSQHARASVAGPSEFAQQSGSIAAPESTGSSAAPTALTAAAAATVAALGVSAASRARRRQVTGTARQYVARFGWSASVSRSGQLERGSRCQRAVSALGVTEAPTASKVVPSSVLESKYGREIEVGVDLFADVMHASCITSLLMEEMKDKTAVGLFGDKMEAKYVRKTEDGEATTIMNAVILAAMGKVLLENFPDDAIYCEEDVELLARDGEFAETVAETLHDFGVVADATAEDVVRWSRHCGTFKAKQASGSAPTRYWALNPIDNTTEMRAVKQFCITLALVEDGQPQVSLVGCPVQAFDHHTRSASHRNGSPVYYAVRGQGAYAQLVLLNREVGVYTGEYRLKGKSLKLQVEEKIHRTNDLLYDVLGTSQLHITMNSRQREDIMVDAERIAKILGSDYPKFDLTTSSIKYAWLAGGVADVVWYFPRGLYDSTATERLLHHVAGTLLAEEAGAACADLDGKPIEWTVPLLEKNRGIVTVDKKKAAMQGVLSAISESTVESTKAFDAREAKKKEMKKMLAHLFKKMAENAETDEEKEGAQKVLEKGQYMLEDDGELDQLAQNSINRDQPLLGEGMVSDNPFDDTGAIPMSPIKSD